jgi:hypothetical protein
MDKTQQTINSSSLRNISDVRNGLNWNQPAKHSNIKVANNNLDMVDFNFRQAVGNAAKRRLEPFTEEN